MKPHPWTVLATLALAVLPAPTVMAARWEFVAQINQNIYYIDPRSVKEEGDHKAAWTLVDYRKPQKLKDGQTYLSTHGQLQIKCKERRARLVHLSYHGGEMMSGAVVQQGGMLQEWLEIEPGSPMHKLAYRLC